MDGLVDVGPALWGGENVDQVGEVVVLAGEHHHVDGLGLGWELSLELVQELV